MFTGKTGSIVSTQSQEHLVAEDVIGIGSGFKANSTESLDNWSCAKKLAVRIYKIVKNTFLLLASIVLTMVSVRAIASSKLNLVIGGSILLALNAPLMNQSASLIYDIVCHLLFFE